MTEPKLTTAYATSTAFTPAPVEDVPDVLTFFVNLRRDLLRKVHDLDVLIARLQKLQKAAPIDSDLVEGKSSLTLRPVGSHGTDPFAAQTLRRERGA